MKILISLFLLGLLSCTKGESPSYDPSDAAEIHRHDFVSDTPKCDLQNPIVVTDQHAPQSDWDKRWWLDKVEKILAPRTTLSRDEKDQLLKLGRVEILDRLMKRPEFLDAALDFNLFFLGFKQDHLHDGLDNYVARVYDFPNAIESALSLTGDTPSHGNYFSLFNLYSASYSAPLNDIRTIDPNTQMTLAQKHQKRVELATDILAKVQRMLDQLNSATEFDPKKFCADFTETNVVNELFSDYGLPINVSFLQQFSGLGLQSVGALCRAQEKMLREDVLLKMQNALAYLKVFLASTDGLDPFFYQPKRLTDIKIFQVPDQSNLTLQFGFTSRLSLTNSSTNYNRKRAAYVLKNFFCDDLTPIQVETPTEHTNGQHGSDTSCFACHYKLDPMAGFFKNYGLFFVNFTGDPFGTMSKTPTIVFDDQANQDLNEYSKTWLAPENAHRKWNIGYVRSTNHEELNDYGESLEDLFTIIQKSPEVKLCLTKRMFEYATSPQQTVDSGFLDYLSERFTQTAHCQDSSLAFKNLVKEVTLSSSFVTRDPVADQCYDFPPGYDPKDAAPCKVNAILARNCTKCHSPSSDESDLDLTHWIRQTDGHMDFKHLDDSGKQYSQKETLEMMQERLQTTNVKKRMPKNHYMNPIEREALFNWTVEILRSSDAQARAEKIKGVQK